MGMEISIGRNNEQLTTSQHLTPPSRWIAEQLLILAEAFGEALTPQRMKIYATDLSDVPPEALAIGFQRVRRQCRFFPKIAEILDLAGTRQGQEQDAEARAAWDTLLEFVGKYVGNDVHGNYGPQHGWYPKDYPRLSDHILDTVRRTGGWRVYACMTDRDFPFVQKRFFEEYAAWEAINTVELLKFICEKPPLQQISTAKDTRAVLDMETIGQAAPEQVLRPKAISAPLSDAQLRDRRGQLKQQAELLKSKRP